MGKIDRREKSLCSMHGWEVFHDVVGSILSSANVAVRLQDDRLAF